MGGEFFDNGELDAIVGTVTVSTKIDVSATGEIIVDGGSVSTASLVNSGVHQSGNTIGNNDGVYVDEAVTPTSGSLTVTGIFTNTGSFGVGDFGGVNVVSIGTLKNQATGQIDIGAATVTITTLTNAGTPTDATPGGIGVDVKSYQAGGGSFKVTGVFTNTGEFAVGHSASMTTVTIGALDNTSTGNLIITAAS